MSDTLDQLLAAAIHDWNVSGEPRRGYEGAVAAVRAVLRDAPPDTLAAVGLYRISDLEQYSHGGDLLYVDRSTRRPYYAGTKDKPANEHRWQPVFVRPSDTRTEPGQ